MCAGQRGVPREHHPHPDHEAACEQKHRVHAHQVSLITSLQYCTLPCCTFIQGDGPARPGPTRPETQTGHVFKHTPRRQNYFPIANNWKFDIYLLTAPSESSCRLPRAPRMLVFTRRRVYQLSRDDEVGTRVLSFSSRNANARAQESSARHSAAHPAARSGEPLLPLRRHSARHRVQHPALHPDLHSSNLPHTVQYSLLQYILTLPIAQQMTQIILGRKSNNRIYNTEYTKHLMVCTVQ